MYQHSQQSWEAFNSLLKTFYFRRTGRGGAANQGRGPKSKLKPVARWIQRRMLWMCNVSYDTMLDYYKNGNDLEQEEEGLPPIAGEDDDDDDDNIHGGGVFEEMTPFDPPPSGNDDNGGTDGGEELQGDGWL